MGPVDGGEQSSYDISSQQGTRRWRTGGKKGGGGGGEKRGEKRRGRKGRRRRSRRIDKVEGRTREREREKKRKRYCDRVSWNIVRAEISGMLNKRMII